MSKKRKEVDVYRVAPAPSGITLPPGTARELTCATFTCDSTEAAIERVLMEYLRWSETQNNEANHTACVTALRHNAAGTVARWQNSMARPVAARRGADVGPHWVRLVVRDEEVLREPVADRDLLAHDLFGKKKTDRLIDNALARLHMETKRQYLHRTFREGVPAPAPGLFKFVITYDNHVDCHSYDTHEAMVQGLQTFLLSHTKEGGLRDSVRYAMTHPNDSTRHENATQVLRAFRKKGIFEIRVTEGGTSSLLPSYCLDNAPIVVDTGATNTGATVANTPVDVPAPVKETTMEETPAPVPAPPPVSVPETAAEAALNPRKLLVRKILDVMSSRYPIQQSFSIGENIIGLRWAKEEDAGDANLILLDLANNRLLVDHDDPARCFNTGLDVENLLTQVSNMPEKITPLGGRPYSQVYVGNAQVFQKSIEALFKSSNLAQVRRAVPGLSQILGIITADALIQRDGNPYTKALSTTLRVQRERGCLRILEAGKGAIELQHSDLLNPSLTVIGNLPRLPVTGYASAHTWGEVGAASFNEAFSILKLCGSREFQNAIENFLPHSVSTYPGKKGVLFHGKFHAYKGGDVDLRNPELSTSLSDLQALFDDLTDKESAPVHATIQHRDRLLDLRTSLPRLVTDVPGLAESLLRLYTHKGGGAYNGREDAMALVGEVYLNAVTTSGTHQILQLKEQDGTGSLTLLLVNEKVTRAMGNDLESLQEALERSYAEVAKLPTLMSQSDWNGDRSQLAAAMYENLPEDCATITPALESAYRSGPALACWRGEGGHLLPLGLFTQGRLTNWMGVTTSLDALPLDSMVKLAACDPTKTLVTSDDHSANLKHAVNLLAAKPANILTSLAARMLAVTPDGPGVYTYRAAGQQATLTQTSTHILLSMTGKVLQGLTYNKQTRVHQLDVGAVTTQALPVLEAMEKEGPALKAQLLEGYLPPESLRVPLSLLPDPEMRANLNELVERQAGRVGVVPLPVGSTTLLLDGQLHNISRREAQPMETGDVQALRKVAEMHTSVVAPRDLALLRNVKDVGVGAYQCALLYLITALGSGRSGFFGRTMSEVVGDLHVTALSTLLENGGEKTTLVLQVGSDHILAQFEKRTDGYLFTEVQYNHSARVWEAVRKIDPRELAEKLGETSSSSLPEFQQIVRTINTVSEKLKRENRAVFNGGPSVPAAPVPAVAIPALPAKPTVVETVDTPTFTSAAPVVTPHQRMLEKAADHTNFVLLEATPKFEEAVLLNNTTLHRWGRNPLPIEQAADDVLDRPTHTHCALDADRALHAAFLRKCSSSGGDVRSVISHVILAAMASDRGFLGEDFCVETGDVSIVGTWGGDHVINLAIATPEGAVLAKAQGTNGKNEHFEVTKLLNFNAGDMALPMRLPMADLIERVNDGLADSSRPDVKKSVQRLLGNLDKLETRLNSATPLDNSMEHGFLQTLRSGILPVAAPTPTPEPTPQKVATMEEVTKDHPALSPFKMSHTPDGLFIDGKFYGFNSATVSTPSLESIELLVKRGHTKALTLTRDRLMLATICKDLDLPSNARKLILSFLFAVAKSFSSLLTNRAIDLVHEGVAYLLRTQGQALHLFVGRPGSDAYVCFRKSETGEVFLSKRNAHLLDEEGRGITDMEELTVRVDLVGERVAPDPTYSETIRTRLNAAYATVVSLTSGLPIERIWEILGMEAPENTQDKQVKEGEEPTPSPKETTMAKAEDKTVPNAEEPSTLERAKTALKSDAHDAAWRTAGSQMVKLTRDPLVGLLSRHLGPDDESLRKKIAEFLSTEVGTALVAALLSTALSVVPSTSEVPQRLARELRVKAMSDMGDLTADVLMGPLRQVIALYLQGVPEVEESSRPALPPASPSATEVLDAHHHGDLAKMGGKDRPAAKA